MTERDAAGLCLPYLVALVPRSQQTEEELSDDPYARWLMDAQAHGYRRSAAPIIGCALLMAAFVSGGCHRYCRVRPQRCRMPSRRSDKSAKGSVLRWPKTCRNYEVAHLIGVVARRVITHAKERVGKRTVNISLPHGLVAVVAP